MLLIRLYACLIKVQNNPEEVKESFLYKLEESVLNYQSTLDQVKPRVRPYNLTPQAEKRLDEDHE